MVSAFELALRTRVVFGAGAVDRLGPLARALGARGAFVVTDAGLVAAGHVARAEASLRGAGLDLRRFDAVRENPTAADVERCVAALGDFPCDLLVGLGGGSSIDVAKGCNFVRAGGGRIEDYRGIGKARGTLLPLIAVPTTAGTGSEMQSFALIAQEETHQKMACGDPRAAPVLALLDPALTVTMPRHVTACTGLDAVGHAVETAVTTKRNPVSALFSAEAFALACAHLPRALAAPADLEARAGMLQAAAFAGIAIEHAMLGAAHALANPLTAHHGIPHGQAVATVLPAVVRHNAQDPAIAPLYAALARRARLCGDGDADAPAAEAVAAAVERLLDAAALPRTLRALGVPAAHLDRLAAEAARQWTAGFNPRPVTAADLRALLVAAS